MADFCMQCSEEMGFSDNDMRGLLTKEQVETGLGCYSLCEGCGPAWVDHEGRCKALDCFCFHGSPNEVKMFTPKYDAEVSRFFAEQFGTKPPQFRR
jgi:hypothetical protein